MIETEMPFPWSYVNSNLRYYFFPSQKNMMFFVYGFVGNIYIRDLGCQ